MQVHARAVDVEVAQRDVGQAVHRVIGAQQPFEHHLAGPVPGVVVVRVVVLAGREAVGHAVDGRRRRGDDLAHAGLLGGLHHVEGAVAHRLQRGARLRRTGGDPQRGHVDHGVHAGGGAADRLRVLDVALLERDARILQGAFDVGRGAADHVVEDHDAFGRVVAQQQVDRRGSDQAGSAGDQDSSAVNIHGKGFRSGSGRDRRGAPDGPGHRAPVQRSTTPTVLSMIFRSKASEQ